MFEKDDVQTDVKLIELARYDLRSRRMRAKDFHELASNEPYWIILLELYVQNKPLLAFNTLSLVALSGASHATGIRWINFLVENGLLQESSSASDKRVRNFSLSDFAIRKLNMYFSTLMEGQHRLRS